MDEKTTARMPLGTDHIASDAHKQWFTPLALLILAGGTLLTFAVCVLSGIIFH
jgi:hypothetical protein